LNNNNLGIKQTVIILDYTYKVTKLLNHYAFCCQS